jgi:HK97 family phage portal protein
MAGQQFTIQGGQLVSIPDNAAKYISDGYNVNDIIYSIINIILDKVRLPQWGIYQVEDESSLKSLYGLMSKKDITAKDYSKILDLRTKALSPVKNPGKWGELVQYPNEYQTFQDLVAHGCGFKLLTGNKYIWADVLDAGANQGLPQNLWLMPSQYVQLMVTNGFPSKVTGYKMTNLANATQKQPFAIEEVFHEKYANYSWNVNGEQHYGIAPLKAALRLTNRNNSALESSTAKFQNGGLDAIIYTDEPGINDLEGKRKHAQLTKESLIKEYTGPKNQGKVSVSPYKMGVANLGLSPVELDIIQAEKWDLRRFCNVFGVPSQLLNDPDNKVYNNTKEGEKALTNRCALPLLTAFRDNMNRKARNDWKLDKRFILDFDIQVFSELQADINEVIDWTSKLIAVKPNDQLQLAGLETSKDPIMDEYWVKPNDRQPMSDYMMNDVDNALEEEP